MYAVWLWKASLPQTRSGHTALQPPAIARHQTVQAGCKRPDSGQSVQAERPRLPRPPGADQPHERVRSPEHLPVSPDEGDFLLQAFPRDSACGLIVRLKRLEPDVPGRQRTEFPGPRHAEAAVTVINDDAAGTVGAVSRTRHAYIMLPVVQVAGLQGRQSPLVLRHSAGRWRIKDMDIAATSANLLAHLCSYDPPDEQEKAYVEETISFLRSCPAPFSRNTAAGHVTVSAVLVDQCLEHTLLLWHRKLGRWLQPGGHCEPNLDGTLVAAALRELEEETGVRPPEVVQLSSDPFDIDVHRIPAQGEVAPHLHYDLRYLFRASPDSAPDIVVDREESGGYTWRRIADLSRET